MYISELMTGAPTNERCPLERRMYETLDKLKIPYERVDNDPAASMEECAEVDKVLGTEIRKNVFLCKYKLVDCLEKCLIYGHIRRVAD